ncbi:hypothetical protein FB385_2144 [Paramicrobacterium agarici]|nr:hypothetical protein FB385_2144 [Microbacterium agarici]
MTGSEIVESGVAVRTPSNVTDVADLTTLDQTSNVAQQAGELQKGVR